MLASWCLSRLGGEAWMRSMMLSKSRWRRWRRALRSEGRSEGAEEWWWRLLAASIPEEEREEIRMAHGKALHAAEWKEWWSGERGLKGAACYRNFIRSNHPVAGRHGTGANCGLSTAHGRIRHPLEQHYKVRVRQHWKTGRPRVE